MPAKTKVAKDIDAYIAGAPEPARPILERVRRTIAKAAPGAQEAISYAIPTFVWNGNLIHFAAYREHIGVYPSPSGAEEDPRLAAYAAGKGTLRFPLSEPLPYTLITRVVKMRMKELAGAARTPRKKRPVSAAPRATGATAAKKKKRAAKR